MAKLLMLGIIIAIVYFFILPRFKRPKNSDKKIQNFVECKKCGTFIDIKESVIKNGDYICKECINKE